MAFCCDVIFDCDVISMNALKSVKFTEFMKKLSPVFCDDVKFDCDVMSMNEFKSVKLTDFIKELSPTVITSPVVIV